MLGAATIFLLQNFLTSIHVPAVWLQVAYGAMLLAGVLIGASVTAPRAPQGEGGGDVSALPEIGDPTPAPEVYGDGRGRRLLHRVAALQRDYPIAQVVALVAIFIYGRSSLEGFGSKQSIYAMLILATLLGLAAAGQTLVLLIGGIDFSIPAFIVAAPTLTVQLKATKGSMMGPRWS